MTDKPDNPTPARSLPEGWVETTLEHVVEVHDNLREPVNADARATRQGPYPYYGATGQVGWMDDFRLDGEYVLLGEDGAPFLDPAKPKAYLVNGKCWVNNHAHVLRGANGRLSNRFLLYALNNVDYHGFANGTTRLKLTQAAMKRIPVRVPPMAVQDAIASRLDELFTDLDAGVAALQRARAKLKRYRASVLKAAVEGRLTAEWREARRAEAGSQTSEVGDQRSDGGGNPMTAESAVPDVAPAARPGSRLSQPEFSFSPPLARPAVPSPTSDLRSLTSRARSLTSELQPPTSESAAELLARILAERRQRWEADQLAKFTKAGKAPPKGWQAKYAEPKAPDSANLPPLPEGWCWVRMDVAGQVQLGRQRAPQHHSGPFMHPYLRVANVYEARLDLSDVMRMNFTPREFDAYSLRYGDILLNEGQSPELVGRAAMFKGEVPECCYQKTLLRFRASCGVLPDYALMVFRAYLRNGRFRRSASITTSIAHLAAERFVQIEFPLPALSEQRQIVDEVDHCLSIADEVEAQIEADLHRAARLRQAILKLAFDGRLSGSTEERP